MKLREIFMRAAKRRAHLTGNPTVAEEELEEILMDQRLHELIPHIKGISLHDWSKIIRLDNSLFTYIPNPSYDLSYMAVQHNGLLLEYIKDQSPELILAAVRQNGHALPFASMQTELICSYAVNQAPRVLLQVLNQTELVCYLAAKKDPETISMIRDPHLRRLIQRKIRKGKR